MGAIQIRREENELLGPGEVEVTDARARARGVQRSPSRVRLRLRALASDNLGRVSRDSDFRHDGGQSSSFASIATFLTVESLNSGLHLPQLINRRCGHVYYIRPRSKEEDKDLGTAHRPLRQRGENIREV